MPERPILFKFPMFAQFHDFERRVTKNDGGLPVAETLKEIGILLDDIAESFFGCDIDVLSDGGTNPRIRQMLARRIVARGRISPDHLAALRRRVNPTTEHNLANLLDAVATFLPLPSPAPAPFRIAA